MFVVQTSLLAYIKVELKWMNWVCRRRYPQNLIVIWNDLKKFIRPCFCRIITLVITDNFSKLLIVESGIELDITKSDLLGSRGNKRS